LTKQACFALSRLADTICAVNAWKRLDLAMERPLPNSYWVIPGQLLAGEHPLGSAEGRNTDHLERLLAAGINFYLDLTEAGEMPEYHHLLPARVEYVHSPILDCEVPSDVSQTRALLDSLRDAVARRRVIYVHCRAGIGRTGLVIGCFLAEDQRSGRAALKLLNRLWRQSARAQTWRKTPQTAQQADYIRRWLKLRESD
jgi:hypothetical protein